ALPTHAAPPAKARPDPSTGPHQLNDGSTTLGVKEGDVADNAGEQVDGRRARGAKRRAETIDATLAVVTRDGAAAGTDRTAVEQARLTTSLSPSCFATLGALLVAAQTSVAGANTAKIRQIIATPADKRTGLAELIAEAAGPRRERALAE